VQNLFHTFAKSENNLQQAQRVKIFFSITSPKKVARKSPYSLPLDCVPLKILKSSKILKKIS
jgi:hypothetical protein